MTDTCEGFHLESGHHPRDFIRSSLSIDGAFQCDDDKQRVSLTGGMYSDPCLTAVPQPQAK